MWEVMAMNTNKIIKIYIKLINENTNVFKPVNAIHIKNNTYKIIDYNHEREEEYGEQWEYNYGDIVACEEENNLLIAIRKIHAINDDIYIDKLLQAASPQIEYERSNTIELNDKIIKVINKKNGFYAFESALHFFSDIEFENINNIIKQENLYDYKGCQYFAEDIFGNLFCIKGDKIFMLDVETGKLDFIANSLDEWANEILKDYNYLTGYSLAHDWQIANGELHRNQRLIPIKLFIFGGTYSIDNLIAKDTFEALRYRSDIAYQLENIKDGEKIAVLPTIPSQ